MGHGFNSYVSLPEGNMRSQIIFQFDPIVLRIGPEAWKLNQFPI